MKIIFVQTAHRIAQTSGKYEILYRSDIGVGHAVDKGTLVSECLVLDHSQRITGSAKLPGIAVIATVGSLYGMHSVCNIVFHIAW